AHREKAARDGHAEAAPGVARDDGPRHAEVVWVAGGVEPMVDRPHRIGSSVADARIGICQCGTGTIARAARKTAFFLRASECLSDLNDRADGAPAATSRRSVRARRAALRCAALRSTWPCARCARTSRP